ncbi:hypothetical protein [Holophaga foetida]|uniref:hypothetical protein n=1 Tax=Holophaga foetida TaxID=35839 RepID=UPI0002473774|nr:hypothetical protein [Holophaga foetida]
MTHLFKTVLYGALLTLPLQAWSPKFHEVQTRMALGMVPTGMKQFLLLHPLALTEGARGIPNDQVPTVEEVEEQFQRVLRMSEERRHPETLVRELGTLAHMAQLLADPSAIRGVTPLREHFEAYADELTQHLVITGEPYWAAKGPLDTRGPLLLAAKTKFQRHTVLSTQFDESTRQRIGSWDLRSLPFAQLQLAFSDGVNSTANLWILAWRATGDLWISPENSHGSLSSLD